MKIFDVETFVVKPEKQEEFMQLRQRFLKYMKKNPEKFKEMKSYKRFVQMWGGISKFIEMYEFDSMADLEKYMMRNPDVAVENQHRAFRWVQDIACSDYAGVQQYAGVHGGGSPRMEQIAILGSYDIEKTKNIAKRLAGIQVKEPYSFDRFGKTL